MSIGRSIVTVAFVCIAGVFVGGSDCVPDSGIGEAADCCACLARADVDGDEASAADNCLPDDLSQGFDQKVEEQQCAADAADSLGGEGRVKAEAACREGDHPCADICGRAADAGVDFID
jgi:hypothetical protein